MDIICSCPGLGHKDREIVKEGKRSQEGRNQVRSVPQVPHTKPSRVSGAMKEMMGGMRLTAVAGWP